MRWWNPGADRGHLCQPRDELCPDVISTREAEEDREEERKEKTAYILFCMLSYGTCVINYITRLEILVLAMLIGC